MSTTETPSESHLPIRPGLRLMQEPTSLLDRAAMYVADLCSPILVKESRQALKSRQFQWTFLALLLAVVVWSFLGVTISMSTLREESGPMMLVGYLFILGFPLAVVIPMAAFRSLAREYEDETIQLVSITSMSARRIVLGKLGSALQQIVLYLAAVTPCIVFAYVLRGISFSMIWIGVSLSLVGSISLTCLALLVAGACRNVFLRVAANLVLLVSLLAAYFGWCLFLGEALTSSIPNEGVIVSNTACIIMAALAYTAIESTTSLISFAAENRSTRVRVSLIVLPIVFFTSLSASATALANEAMPVEFVALMLSLIGTHYFTIIGCMTASERSGLSNRVRRELPRTWYARMFLGLLYPGPGRGYLFGLLAIIACNAVSLFIFYSDFLWDFFGLSTQQIGFIYPDRGILVNVIFGCGYLSVVYLLMLLLERYAGEVKVLIGLLLGVILYALLAIFSFSLHEFTKPLGSNLNMSAAYYLNWAAMIDYSQENGGVNYHLLSFAMLIGIPSTVLTLCAYVLSLRELAVTVSKVPQRVLDELAKPQRPTAPKGETFEEIFQQRHDAAENNHDGSATR